MSAPIKSSGEGGLKTPQRHPLDWKNPDFYNEKSLFKELERVFDICHGCRRCFNLCNAFPTLFDAVDESETMELDGVPKKVFWDVVDHCYLCDICFMTKCPHVPPHEWNLDFPHLMLRAKAVNFKKGETKFRDKFLTSTDRNGKLFSIPFVAQIVNTANKIGFARKMLQSVLGIHADAKLPAYQSDTLEKRAARRPKVELTPEPTDMTTGKVALFGTCYGNYNEPGPGEDLMTVFEHNGIPMILAQDVQCCGMPKLELGDLAAIQSARDANIPVLARLVDEGWDLTALVPSCVLMFKQELPLFFPDDAEVRKQALTKMIGIEHSVHIQVDGFDPVTPIANEDLERETEEKTSSVHFLRFELTAEMIAAAKDGAAISAAIDHPAYRYQTDALPEATRACLAGDLD